MRLASQGTLSRAAFGPASENCNLMNLSRVTVAHCRRARLVPVNLHGQKETPKCTIMGISFRKAGQRRLPQGTDDDWGDKWQSSGSPGLLAHSSEMKGKGY